MTTEPIVESGMRFGPYPEGHCFHIEQSKTYQRIKKDQVKIAEFLLYRNTNPPTLLIIEAKSSSPRPETQPDFDEFIAEIQEKFSNTLHLFIATRLKRHPTWSECSEIFQNIDLEIGGFRLILIINGHQEEWLPPLQDALRQALKPIVKIWNLESPSVAVMNEDMAQEQGIIEVAE
ncbi:MAG: hypothetical protein F6J92_01485 [Symploca sp. SIO1A3]|nr:hypothetical protein [Symploca sp. SIO1A3]